MILCDIGNTNFHFNDNGKVFDEKKCSFKNKKIYFISVNQEKTKELLHKNPNSVDLGKFVSLNTSYQGLGVDRMMACKTIKDGIVVDAGSAITIDIMANGIHLGGYILPGIFAIKQTYDRISPKLNCEFVSEIKTNLIPSNTKEAVGYGMIGMIINMISKVAKNEKIYFTGGDGAYLSRFFENAIFLRDLVFWGMKETIKENNL